MTGHKNFSALTNRMSPESRKRAEAANTNESVPENAITLGDLAKASGIGEDTLMQRIAGVLSRRDQAPT